MRALTAIATVRADHSLTMQVPADVPAGSHRVVVVFEEAAPKKAFSNFFADWPAHDVSLVDPQMTFRREDIYGDDGR
jgi:hypothetical protein